MIKKIFIISLVLFLAIGIVSANSDANSTVDTAKAPVIKKTTISVKQVSGKEKTKVKITAKIKDGSGKPLQNIRITFKIKGKTYTKTTDSAGNAYITYKLPKAKYQKTTSKKKGNIITKTKIYKSASTVKVSFKGTKDYSASSVSSKVISKKSPVVKKYRYKLVKKTVTVPCKKGDHTYIRGPVAINVILGKDYGNDDLWIACDSKDHKTRLSISTKLHFKDKNGNWKWDRKWKHMKSEHDLISEYYGKLPKTDLIKVRYQLLTYTLIE